MMCPMQKPSTPMKSPSLRGSGLKSKLGMQIEIEDASPSLRGSGLKLMLYR